MSNNPFLDTLDEQQGRAPAPAQTSTNPFLKTLDERLAPARQQLNFVVENALRDDPEIAAERQRISNTTGLPLRVVERNLDELRVKERAKALDLVRLMQSSPTLAQRLADPEFAAVAVDDTSALATIETSVAKAARYMMGAAPTNPVSDAIDIGKTLGLAGTVGVGKMLFEMGGAFNDMLGMDNAAASARAAAKRAGEAMNTYGVQAETDTGKAFVSGLQSAGVNLALLPLGLERALFQTSAAAATAVAAVMGLGVGAEAYNKARDAGKGKVASAVYAAPEAAFEFLFEKIPAQKLFGDLASNAGLWQTLKHQAVSETWTEQMTTLAQDFNEWMNMNPDKTIGQFLAERPDAAYQTLIATLTGVGVQTGAIHTVNKIVEKATNQALRFQQDEFEAQLKAAGLSALRERSPEQFRSHLQAVLEGTDGAKKTIFVDGAVLAQMPPDLLAQLPASVQEQIAPAAASGGAVSIPLADVLTVAPGTPLEEALNLHARMDEFALSKADVQDADTLHQAMLRDSERVLAQAEDEVAARQSADNVRATILAEINATGRYRPAVAQGMAEWAAAFFNVYGSRVGMTAEEFYQAHRLRILGSTSGTGETYARNRAHALTVEGYHYSPEARTTVSTTAFGTGLQGSGRDTYLNAQDQRLRNRAYFYVDKGTGINPESGVGGQAHRARLSNIYDANADPLRLRGGDQLAFESAVLDAGFSGYLDRLDGTQSGHVVMLGKQDLPVESLGPMGKTQGAVVPAPAARESRGRDVTLDALAARKDLPAGQLSPQRWGEVLAKLAPTEHAALAAAGVFDGKDPMYKSELLAAFKAATPAPDYNEAPSQSEDFLAQLAKVDAGAHRFPEVVSALGLTPQEIDATVIGMMTGLPGGAAFATPNEKKMAIPEVVKFLHARRMASGLPVLDISKPEDRAQLARLVAAEALADIKSAGDSLEWYDQTIRSMLAAMSLIHPELKSEPHARNVFLIATAITSQGLNPLDNLKFALTQYGEWRRTGKFPEKGQGADGAAMTSNFIKANKLMELLEPGELADFLVTEFTVKELASVGFDVSGENMETQVLGSAVFGPKIGFGFYSNLNGNFEPTTMDMWFMRTFGRLAGTLPDFDPARYANQLARFRAGLQETPQADGIYADSFDPAMVEKAMTDDEAALALARLVNSRHQKDFVDNRAQFDAGTRKKSTIVGAAATMIQSMDKPKDVPANGTERNHMRDVMAQVVSLVEKHHGKRIPPASLQALIWYPEQELYSAFGVRLRVTSTDYATAARGLAKEAGFKDADINAAIGSPAKPGPAGVRSTAGGNAAGGARAASNRISGAVPLEGRARLDAIIALQDARTLAALGFTGSDTLLNVRLDDPNGGPRLTIERIRKALTKLKVKVKAHVIRKSDSEDTEVIAIDKSLTSAQLGELSAALGQQAVVQRNPDGSGDLQGPMAKEWGPYNSAFFVMPDGARANTADQWARLTTDQQGVLRGLLDRAGQLKPQFDSVIAKLAEVAGGTPELAPIKGLDRATAKIAVDYQGDASKIKDLLRATIVVSDVAEAQQLADALFKVFDVLPTGQRNLLTPDAKTLDGYRDVKVNVDLGGLVAEVQINLPQMIEAKKTLHKPYEEREALVRMLTQEARPATQQEAATIAALNQQMQAGYDAAFAAATSASKASLETTAPLRKADSPSKTRGGSTSKAAAYGKPGTPSATGTPSTSKYSGIRFTSSAPIVPGADVLKQDSIVLGPGPSNAGPRAAVAELQALGQPNPLDPRQIVLGDTEAVIEVSTFDGMLWFDFLQSVAPGGGTLGLRTVLDVADRHGVKVGLHPKQVGTKGLSTKKLIAWYGRHGFVKQGDIMVRPPQTLAQGPRGTFNPKSLDLVLSPNADLSTFFHETGHFFLEVMMDVASQPGAPAQIVADAQTFLKWAGVADMATWNGMSLDQRRGAHEAWAAAIEQYIMEGKSANPEMATLMRRFSAWLKSVYKSIQAFVAGNPDAQRAPLNDDIRRVMDRMVATDDQIAHAEEVAGFVPDEQATGEALERLRARSMRDLRWVVSARDAAIKKLGKAAKEAERRIREEVTKEVNDMREVKAKELLGQVNKENEGKMGDTERAIIADAFGFESVDEMLRAIDAFGSKSDVITGMVDQRMLEEHGDLINPEAIAEAANEAVHNEARARALATELRTQREMINERSDTGKTNKAGSRVTVNAVVEAAKQFGASIVGRTPLRDLKSSVWKHVGAERRAGKRWEEATAAGKTEEAVRAKQDQVLQNGAATAATKAVADTRKMLDFFKQVLKGGDEKTVKKGRDPDIVNVARAILGMYGFETPTTKHAVQYLEALAENDPETFNALKPSVDGAVIHARPLDSLTYDELVALHEEIQSIWHLAKVSRQMEVDGAKKDIDDAEDEIVKALADKVPATQIGKAHAVTESEQRVRWLQTARALLRRVEQWAEGLDGKFGGPLLRLVYQPVKDAEVRYLRDRTVYRKKFQALLDNVAPLMRHELISAPELGYTFGKGHNGIGTAELLHAMLHTGNDSNKRKLLLGRNWGAKNADGSLNTAAWDTFIERMHNEGKITKAHWDFVQGVWDLLEELKPMAQETHRSVFGRYFAEVTSNAFVTPFGSYRGGYVPAQADPLLTQDADVRKMAELENQSLAFSFPATSKGFTQSRVEYNRPLKLDLRTLPQHIDQVILFSHMEPAVRGVTRLLRRKGVSQVLGAIDPTAYGSMLLPWLNRSARHQVETPVAGDGRISRVLSVLRQRAGAALMFANISNTVQQITGLSSAVVKVKASHLMRATAQMVSSPKETRAQVASASEYMATRMENEVAAMSDAMDEILLKPSLYRNAQAWATRHTYFMQQAVDNALGPIVWIGAYNQGLAEGMDERMAIRFADGAVRQTQGALQPSDVSRLETGPAYARMFTQFIGYFNMLANTNGTALQQIANEMGLKKGAGKALGVVFFGLLLPMWVAEAIAIAFRGGPDDEDKDGYLDDWLAAVLGMGTIKASFAMVPFVGQIGQLVVNRFNDQPADDRFSLSPAVSLLESAARVPHDIYLAATGKANAQRTIRDSAALVQLLTGLPTYAAARPLGYAAGVMEDRIDPTSVVDAVRGGLTGTASPESKNR